MDKLLVKVDDFVTSLWLETAGLTLAMSAVFVLVIEVF